MSASVGPAPALMEDVTGPQTGARGEGVTEIERNVDFANIVWVSCADKQQESYYYFQFNFCSRQNDK